MGAADRGECRQAAGAVAQGVRNGLDGHTVLGISVMAKADTRDAKTMMAEIKAEFRRALKATRKFQAFFTAERDHTRRAAEWIHRFGEWATESEPFERCRSYCGSRESQRGLGFLALDKIQSEYHRRHRSRNRDRLACVAVREQVVIRRDKRQQVMEI